MSQKARLWIGSTILAVMIFNYAVIGIPLYRRMDSLRKNIKVMMIKELKKGRISNDSEGAYIIDILKKESVAVDRKIIMLNRVAVSAAIIVMVWIMYGLIIKKKGGPKS